MSNPTIASIVPEHILDGTKSQDLRQQIGAAIEAGAAVILVDLSKTNFIDSSGLGALVLSLKAARAAGVKLYLCGLNDQAQMLFELTSMSRVFETFPTAEDFRTQVLGE